MMSKLSRALCATACALALSACNDPNAVDASIPTIADTLVVFAVNGTAPAAPDYAQTARSARSTRPASTVGAASRRTSWAS